MDHHDHVALLREGVAPGGGAWADLGAGEGAFTLALADLLGPGAQIVAVDRDERALRRQARSMAARFPAAEVEYVAADFSRPLELPPLDGVLMANSLHFQPRPGPVLAQVYGYLRPGGRLIVVEYNTDRGNRWVPYPIAYSGWVRLAAAAGFVATRQIGARPSRFLREIYSALSLKSGGAG